MPYRHGENMPEHQYDQAFLDRIHARLDIEGEDGCWVWTGAKNRQGYGNTSFRGQAIVVHRAMYEVYVGPIPEGYAVDHIACSNKSCANPKHLRACTWSENLLHRGPNKKTHTGIRNVYFNPKPGLLKPWHVSLTVRRKRVVSAYFATKDEAVTAAHEARMKHLGWDGLDRSAA